MFEVRIKIYCLDFLTFYNRLHKFFIQKIVTLATHCEVAPHNDTPKFQIILHKYCCPGSTLQDLDFILALINFLIISMVKGVYMRFDPVQIGAVLLFLFSNNFFCWQINQTESLKIQLFLSTMTHFDKYLYLTFRKVFFNFDIYR